MRLFKSYILVPLCGVIGIACATADDASDATSALEVAAHVAPSQWNSVDITVSAKRTPLLYEARSFPDDDANDNGKIELYNTPVYELYLDGKIGEKPVRRTWKALRFMPFYNSPNVESMYKTQGWANAGLRYVARKPIPSYLPNYAVHNSFTPFGGALVVQGSFFIHAGPQDVSEAGWGAAGCVEIIGNFDTFKKDILELSGSTETNLTRGVTSLVSAGKLFVQYERAVAPNLKANFSREATPEKDEEAPRRPSGSEGDEPNSEP
jgi:hypothetical protein